MEESNQEKPDQEVASVEDNFETGAEIQSNETSNSSGIKPAYGGHIPYK